MKTTGKGNAITQTAVSGVSVAIIRGEDGRWHIEGEGVILSAKNSFPYLREARAYLRTITSEDRARRGAPPRGGATRISPTADDAAKSATLRELVTASGLARAEAAAAIHASPRALDCWLLPVASRGHREPPEMAVEMARIKLTKGADH